MALDIIQSVDIIEIMENYMTRVRPTPEIRNRIDLGYEIENQSIILNEIRPFWHDPSQIITSGSRTFGKYIGDGLTINGICTNLYLPWSD
jgi:hypothetical protein